MCSLSQDFLRVKIVWCHLTEGLGESGGTLDTNEFARARKAINKSQRELAHLLGVSVRAIQSFEQGWRPVPVHVERQLLFLLAMRRQRAQTPCWEMKGCPKEIREKCPAWEFHAGHLCWFITGTICRGRVEASWKQKIAICRTCEVFKSNLSSGEEGIPFLDENSPLP